MVFQISSSRSELSLMNVVRCFSPNYHISGQPIGYAPQLSCAFYDVLPLRRPIIAIGPRSVSSNLVFVQTYISVSMSSSFDPTFLPLLLPLCR